MAGLVYVDLYTSFEEGIRDLIRALEHEASRYEVPDAIGRLTRLLAQVFGGHGWSSTSGEFTSQDHEFFTLETRGGKELQIAYHLVHEYGVGRTKPLSEAAWFEYQELIDSIPEEFFLLVSERPIDFRVGTELEGASGRLRITTLPSPWEGIDRTTVVTLDASGLADDAEVLDYLKSRDQRSKEPGERDRAVPQVRGALFSVARPLMGWA